MIHYVVDSSVCRSALSLVIDSMLFGARDSQLLRITNFGAIFGPRGCKRPGVQSPSSYKGTGHHFARFLSDSGPMVKAERHPQHSGWAVSHAMTPDSTQSEISAVGRTISLKQAVTWVIDPF